MTEEYKLESLAVEITSPLRSSVKQIPKKKEYLFDKVITPSVVSQTEDVSVFRAVLNGDFFNPSGMYFAKEMAKDQFHFRIKTPTHGC